MLRAKSHDTFIFGLTKENIKRLKEGKPINVDLSTMGSKGNIVLFYGRDDEALQSQLEQAIGGPITKQ